MFCVNREQFSPDSCRSMSKVVIMGASFDTGNMGVSALAASLVKLTTSIDPNAEISFFVGGTQPKVETIRLAEREVRVRIVNFRMSPKARFKEHLLWLLAMAFAYRLLPNCHVRSWINRAYPALRTLNEADLIGDIRGGDSFSDIYGLKSLVIGSLPSIIALVLGKRLTLLPQTYGPYSTIFGRSIARRVLSRSETALSRDTQGAEVIRRICKRSPGPNILFCPDVAFGLDAVKPSQMSIVPPLPSQRTGPILGLNVSGLLYNGGFTRNNMFQLRLDYREFVRAFGERFLQETPRSRLLLVPHTFAPAGHVESDDDACSMLAKELSSLFPSRVHLVSTRYNQSEIKAIIGACDFFVGSRMHACIAALSQSIPTVGVAYSRKFIGVFESVQMSHLVMDARTMETEETIDKIMNAFSARDLLKPALSENVLALKGQLLAAFNILLLKKSARRPSFDHKKETVLLPKRMAKPSVSRRVLGLLGLRIARRFRTRPRSNHQRSGVC